MSYNLELAEKLRDTLKGTENLVEKKMFGGLAFLIDDKMCIGIKNDDIMLRCIPERTDELLSKKGAKPFDLTGKPMRGWLLIEPEGYNSKIDFDWWLKTAVDASQRASMNVKKINK